MIATRRYELEERLGAGGVAELFLARCSGFGYQRPAVIKRLRPEHAGDPELVEMLLNEARLLAQLDHPNVPRVLDVGQHEGDVFVALEYVAGGSVRELVERVAAAGEPLSPSAAVAIVVPLLAALDAAHRLQDAGRRQLAVVHRDVDPSNILVSYQGAVKLIDFGVARSLLAETHHHALKGKLAYMSPEQVRREPLDGRSDLFAVGATLFELLAGRPLFRRDGVEETIRAVLVEPVPWLRDSRPDLPQAIDVVIQRALCRSAAQRYQSAAEMAAELRALALVQGWGDGARELADLMARMFAAPPPAPVDDERTILEMMGAADPTVTEVALASEATVVRPSPVPRRRRRMRAALVTALAFAGVAAALVYARPMLASRARATATLSIDSDEAVTAELDGARVAAGVRFSIPIDAGRSRLLSLHGSSGRAIDLLLPPLGAGEIRVIRFGSEWHQ